MTASMQGEVGPLMRRGPRPLLLHLTLAMLKSTASLATPASALAGLPSLNAGSTAWSRAAADIAAALQGREPAFSQEVLAETLRQDAGLITGIAAYRAHPYARTLADPPAIWAEGGSRVLDYAAPDAEGPPVLFVPSLVNRAYVLDLASDRSLMRFMAANGVRATLLDWGWPGEIERGFGLTDYIAGRLERAVANFGQPVVLAGYCMGGLLTLALAQRRPDLARGLALLATPWDFHAADPEAARRLAAMLPLIEPALAFGGTLPVDMLQMLFALLDPWGIATKYRGFADLDPVSPRAIGFVALEDWLNDGIPLAAPVARETLGQWYGANATARGEWRVAGLPVDPTRITAPALVAVPAADRIVPPESARPLAALLARAHLIEPRAGHIGMAAGASAERVLWRPLLAWIRGLE